MPDHSHLLECSYGRAAARSSRLEVRDDVAFQDKTVKDIVFELANSELEGPLTLAAAQMMLSRLS